MTAAQTRALNATGLRIQKQGGTFPIGSVTLWQKYLREKAQRMGSNCQRAGRSRVGAQRPQNKDTATAGAENPESSSLGLLRSITPRGQPSPFRLLDRGGVGG